jgi:hypothetical protein
MAGRAYPSLTVGLRGSMPSVRGLETRPVRTRFRAGAPRSSVSPASRAMMTSPRLPWRLFQMRPRASAGFQEGSVLLLRDVERFASHPANGAFFRVLVRFDDLPAYGASPFAHDVYPAPRLLGRSESKEILRGEGVRACADDSDA